VQKLREEKPEARERLLLYLDNATYHTTADTLELFKLLKLNYVFAPAYLSPLNPIEYFFGVLKGRLRHRNIVTK